MKPTIRLRLSSSKRLSKRWGTNLGYLFFRLRVCICSCWMLWVIWGISLVLDLSVHADELIHKTFTLSCLVNITISIFGRFYGVTNILSLNIVLLKVQFLVFVGKKVGFNFIWFGCWKLKLHLFLWQVLRRNYLRKVFVCHTIVLLPNKDEFLYVFL